MLFLDALGLSDVVEVNFDGDIKKSEHFLLLSVAYIMHTKAFH